MSSTVLYVPANRGTHTHAHTQAQESLHTGLTYYHSSQKTPSYQLASSFEENRRSVLINKMHCIYWLDLLIGCPCSAVLYQQVSDFLICSSRSPSRLHNILAVFLLGSKCKAITHWRVCLNHTEWLWILNAGLGPTEKQAHGRDSVSWVLIWFLTFFPPFLQTALTIHC